MFVVDVIIPPLSFDRGLALSMSLSEQFSIKVLGQEVCYFSLRLDKLIKFFVAICAGDLSVDHD